MKKITILTALLILATGLAGCSGSNSESPVTPVATIDTAPPAVPTGLAASSGRSAVKLDWRANTTDADFQGFMVYRLAFGETWPLTTELVQDPRFLDSAPLRGRATYAVTSVDANGNESAWAQIQFDFEQDLPEVTNP